MMNFEGLMEKFAENSSHGNSPNVNHEIQYPTEFKNQTISFRAESFYKEAITTIVIATECKEYQKENFERDIDETSQYFNLQPYQIIKVLLKPVEIKERVLDAKNAASQMRYVVDMLNTELHSLKDNIDQNPALKFVRIISCGVAYPANFIFQALEYLLNEWLDPEKHIQFVTYGEVEGEKYLKFWKDAVISKLCVEVQYVRLDEYLPFGYYRSKCRKFT